VLNDASTREMYDRYGSSFEGVGAGGPGGGWAGGGGGRGPFPGAGGFPGGGEIDLESLFGGAGGFADMFARLFRETHHAVVLENWGLLWMWHSVVILALCVTTDVLAWQGVTTRWPYLILWAGGLALWAPIFWALRQRSGPVTAVERQIAHIWGGSVIASVMLFWVEALLDLPVLTLSPVLALLAGLIFFAKAGILSGAFYIQAAVLFATALVMCVARDVSHVIFGVVSGICFFVPGLKYFRQRGRG
jgi:serine/threonine-protein kinase